MEPRECSRFRAWVLHESVRPLSRFVKLMYRTPIISFFLRWRYTILTQSILSHHAGCAPCGAWLREMAERAALARVV